MGHDPSLGAANLRLIKTGIPSNGWHRQNAPYEGMQSKDGYLMVGAAGEAIWARRANTLAHPEWCEDSRCAVNQQRTANREALEDVMNAVLTTKITNDWVKVLEAAGVPCGPVYD
jgi:crotonobetainyl-CoA:carnitine CoA-transferase CaiB-like acyl-CoA transferase